jgi:hypothetical protein
MSRSRMITLALLVLAGLVVQAVWTMSASAALAGRLPRTPNGTDYQAWYDDQQNLTWLIDGPWIRTLGYDGEIDWPTLSRQVAYLSVDGLAGWRLPEVDANRDGIVEACSSVDRCLDNELGHFYLSVLASGQPGVLGAHQGSKDGPPTLPPDYYWTATACPSDYECRVAFGMFGPGGVTVRSNVVNTHRVIVVRTGDVGQLVKPDRRPRP